jgi:hypothetical protein
MGENTTLPARSIATANAASYPVAGTVSDGPSSCVTQPFIQHTKDEQIATKTVMHDRDATYRQVFDETLRAAGIEPMLNQFQRSQ